VYSDSESRRGISSTILIEESNETTILVYLTLDCSVKLRVMHVNI